MGKSLKKNLVMDNPNCQIDFGCAIQHGAFWVDIDSEFSVKVSTQEEALLFFFLQLLKALQSIGTVPAIDINEYSKSLSSYKNDIVSK